jgi:hypothetical protein
MVIAMGRRLDEFPEGPGRRRYPWADWTDGGVWEIRRGEDYDVATENMRTNLHMRAEKLAVKVRTQKIAHDGREGLVFQFARAQGSANGASGGRDRGNDVSAALRRLYDDLIDIYERARREVTIERSDGGTQKYAAVRFKQQVERAFEQNELVPAVARIVKRKTLGFGHLEQAGRSDLMVESLVVDASKPYHRLFSPETIRVARERLAALDG